VQYTFQPQYVVQSWKDKKGTRTYIILDQPQEISSLELVINRGKDVTRGIQPKFMYQSASLDYYELMEYWEVKENTNINVVEEIKENYLWSFEYVKA